eukprot:2067240-Amphidinium_carterae.1
MCWMTSKDVKGCEVLAACTEPPKRSNGTDSGSLTAALGGSNADLFNAPDYLAQWAPPHFD